MTDTATIDRIAAIARRCREARDGAALDQAMCESVASADAETIWSMLLLEDQGDILGDAELPTAVVEAIARRGLAAAEPKILAIAVRMSHFHCAALVAGDIRKASGQRALAGLQTELRAGWDDAAPAMRATMSHALAAANVTTAEDVERVVRLLGEDDPGVVSLALMVLAAVGDDQRDSVLDGHLEHGAALVRFMAAVGLAREGGVRPLGPGTVNALRAAYREPPGLPAWWMFRWPDGLETATDLAERMLEEAGVDVVVVGEPHART